MDKQSTQKKQGSRRRGGAKRTSKKTNDTGIHAEAPIVPLRKQLAAKGAAMKVADNDGVERVVPANLSKQVVRAEYRARFHVYDYAASQGLIPDVRVESKQSAARRGSRLPRQVLQVTIKLPEQGIEVSGASDAFIRAEIAACIQFKQKAEEYQSRLQAGAAVESNDFRLLTCETSNNFFDYLKFHRKEEYNLTYERTKCSPRSEEYYEIWVTDALGTIVGAKIPCKGFKVEQNMAWLVAAVEIAKKNPDLLVGFKQAMIEGGGQISAPIPPANLEPGTLALRTMHNVLSKARTLGLPMAEGDVNPGALRSDHRVSEKPELSPDQRQSLSGELLTRLQRYEWNPRLQSLRSLRNALPMNQYRDQVLKMINENIYSIVVGATGSGKTTQVPQILLENAIRRGEGAECNIICTQPRRIAAISVAQRVAVERDEPLRHSIGYHVRYDKQVPAPGGSVTFCTTGILLELLKHDPDNVFKSLTHLLIDEVHERDLNIDFLMIVLKKAMKARLAAGKSVPRVVLMSATLDTALFSKYFSYSEQPGVEIPCPSISVPGRTFPVQEKYLDEILAELESVYGGQSRRLLSESKCARYLKEEKNFSQSNSSNVSTGGSESVIDWKRQKPSFKDGWADEQSELDESLVPIPLVAATLAHICRTTSNGAILVFLPGFQEIVSVQEILQTQKVLEVDFKDASRFRISVLHSSVSKEDQSAVFDAVPPGCRKIILSTNIAETSVTIPDVQYVVDSGKLREKRYDQLRRITKLDCTWISKSNSKQRAGRAGRVQNGNYYALFTRERFENLRSIGLPELLRSDLQETCLATKMHAIHEPVADFLAQAIEPPAPAAIATAVKSLRILEALTESEELTALGQLLARLPVHPTLGKMIVLGVIFKCLDPLLVLSAAAGEKQILLEPLGARAEARRSHQQFQAGQRSDHISMLNAFNKLREMQMTLGIWKAMDYGHANFLHMGAFKNVSKAAESVLNVLVNVGLMPRVSPRELRGSMFGHPSLNVNSNNVPLIKSLILAGFHPNLAVQTHPRAMLLSSKSAQNLWISQSSINKITKLKRDDQDSRETYQEKTFFTYAGLHSNNDGGLSIRENTVVTPLMATLFAGKLEKKGTRSLQADRWLSFVVKGDDPQGATNLIFDFKEALDLVMSHAFRSLSSLGNGSLPRSEVRDTLIQGLIYALNEEDFHLNQKMPRMGRYQLGQERDFSRTDRLGEGRSEAFGDRWSRGRDDSSPNTTSLRSPTPPRIRIEPSQRRPSLDHPTFARRPSVSPRPLLRSSPLTDRKDETSTKKYPHLFSGV